MQAAEKFAVPEHDSVAEELLAAGASADVTEVPVIDVGPVFRGEPGALEKAGAELRYACEQVGFYLIVNHGIPWDLVRRTFDAARRFHALPLEEKLPLKINENMQGYLPYGGTTTRTYGAGTNKPNVNASFFAKRDLGPDHPDVVNKQRYRGLNQWPPGLPGFRETVVEYSTAMEAMAQRLLPIYATALGLPKDFFQGPFTDPMYNLRMTHYPARAYDRNEYAIAPHRDKNFMTLLPANDVPGLQVLTTDARWIDIPPVPESFVVNSGYIIRSWTNDRFLATPHRVFLEQPTERYAIPFFFDAHHDYVMECLPTCTGPANPPKYEPFTYVDYSLWFQRRNYDHVRKEFGVKD